MDNVTSMEDFKLSKEPHYAVIAMCMPCSARWIGTVAASTSLFKLECPTCGAQESFASILPPDYLDKAGKAYDEK